MRGPAGQAGPEKDDEALLLVLVEHLGGGQRAHPGADAAGSVGAYVELGGYVGLGKAGVWAGLGGYVGLGKVGAWAGLGAVVRSGEVVPGHPAYTSSQVTGRLCTP